LEVGTWNLFAISAAVCFERLTNSSLRNWKKI